MKNLISRIWVPTLLVLVAAVQSFGIDMRRTACLRRQADSLLMSRTMDSSAAVIQDSLLPVLPDSTAIDSSAVDSTAVDTSAVDTVIIQPRDTIRIPDSLEFKDPFFFKYYIAVKDSATRAEVRDSLLTAGDTLELMKLVSLYIKDSTEVAIAKFNELYASLPRKERKK